MLIWHIDDAQQTNTDENHYKVALMQADGKRDMEHNVNRGDAGDPYPGSSNNRTFNATSNPSSKSYANSDSCVAVTGISASGAVDDDAASGQVSRRASGAERGREQATAAAMASRRGCTGTPAQGRGRRPRRNPQPREQGAASAQRKARRKRSGRKTRR